MAYLHWHTGDIGLDVIDLPKRCYGDSMGTEDGNFRYWNNKLESILNYKFITAKPEIWQGFKKVFLGEDIFGSSSILLRAFLTNINGNADFEKFSNILICSSNLVI